MLVLPAALIGLVLGITRLGIGQQALDVFFFRSSREVEIGAGSPVLAVVAFLLVAFGEVMFVWRAGIADEREEEYVLTARAGTSSAAATLQVVAQPGPSPSPSASGSRSPSPNSVGYPYPYIEPLPEPVILPHALPALSAMPVASS